ncbi:MAG: PAS domain-containing protein [SAR324 cluster bacterium]|nr:PAS domain-containing protein [SAR324 cluster bacterium]
MILQSYLIILIVFLYLCLLFAVAQYAEKRANAGKSIINNPWTYSLSIGVYCTAWTFYGSVGRAAATGLGFLGVYIGPTLMALLWWFVLRKIVRISKIHRITTIADFISSRYGKSFALSSLVTLVAVVGIMPYISLQLKAVSSSLNVILQYPHLAPDLQVVSTFTDSAFYIALMMVAFTIMFGTRRLDASEQHEGLIAVVAFESIIKLFAFLAVGLFVVYGMYGGMDDIYVKARMLPEMKSLFYFKEADYTTWMWLIVLSMMASMFLPRQFQVMVVENLDEKHIKQAMWVFPLYMLLITLFTLPIAFGGMLRFAQGSLSPDTFVLTLPLVEQNSLLVVVAFIGGLAAATSMVVVATIAIGTMVSNDLVLPILFKIRAFQISERDDISHLILGIRRVAIIVVILLGYLNFRLIGSSYALVSIGLLSFAAAAQFGPAILGGLYWKDGTRTGALAGLSAGILVWLYTMMLPALAKSGWFSISFIEEGLFGIAILKPYQLMGLEGLNWLVHGSFWSLLVNVGCYVSVSIWTGHQSAIERHQAATFVDVFKRKKKGVLWHDRFVIGDLQKLLIRFLGIERTEQFLSDYERIQGELESSPELADYAEKMIAGAIGSASARVVLSSVMEEAVDAGATYMEIKKALRESEERLQTIMDNAPSIIYLKDTQGHYLLVNQEYERLYHISREEMVGKTDYDVHAPEIAKVFQENDQLVLAGNEPLQFEETALDDGNMHTYLSVKFPIYDVSGNIYGICGISTDITKRKKSEQERELLITKLEGQKEELERFTYTVSHDLKSPVVTVRGFLGFLERDLSEGRKDRIDKSIQRIYAATDKMNTLLEELLELSRIGRLSNPSETVSFRDLVEESLNAVGGRLEEKNIHLNVLPDLPEIYGDRPRLLEIVENLIDNAAKYMGDQPKPCIEVGARYHNEEIILYVQDNGIGIESEYHENVFGLFDKLDPNTEGTGIGLAVVKRVVEVHGGRIWVESKGMGQGSTFCFTLASQQAQQNKELQ